MSACFGTSVKFTERVGGTPGLRMERRLPSVVRRASVIILSIELSWRDKTKALRKERMPPQHTLAMPRLEIVHGNLMLMLEDMHALLDVVAT